MNILRKDRELYPDSYCYERAKRLGTSSTGIRDAQYRLSVTHKKTLKHPKADLEKRSIFCRGLMAIRTKVNVVMGRINGA